jgi:Domain of unknown function (DUF4276)
VKIQPVVEGHGETEALPVLLRRLRDEAGAFAIDIGRPIRRHRSELVNEESLRIAVRLALLQRDCGAVLVLLDGDEDCPATLGPQIQGWAQTEAGTTACAVVIAHREYEAWFVAAHESIVQEPEAIRDAKGRMVQLVGSYLPTVDQPSHSAAMSLARAHQRSRSFRRLVRAAGQLMTALGAELPQWPPVGWSPLD